jgi:hypothetical protein
MKRLTTIILLTITLFAANAKSLFQHKQTPEKLVLNNGAKWKIDQSTKNNTILLQQIVKVANRKTVKTLSDYHQTGTALQAGINQLIKECRMKGADHLALHKWLEPLMEKVAQLNQASDATTAARLIDTITAQLSLFNQYFQI